VSVICCVTASARRSDVVPQWSHIACRMACWTAECNVANAWRTVWSIDSSFTRGSQ